MTRDEVMDQMMECSIRLSFSLLEIMYIIGRARTRPVNPWNSEQIAGKLGISVETLTTYEAMVEEDAKAANPLLRAVMAQGIEIDQRTETAIQQEQKRRNEMAQKLADEWIDPGTRPIMRKAAK